MNNKGQITVFLTLLICCLFGFWMTCIEVTNRYCAESKSAMVTKSAMSGIKAGYNSYIFEHYHLLLFDKTFDGSGEAALEEQLKQDVKCNLGQGFSVEEVVVENYVGIMDDECQAFKEQISEYALYGIVENGCQYIVDEAGGQMVPEDIIEDMQAAKDGQESNANVSDNGDYGGEGGDKDNVQGNNQLIVNDLEDPRDVTKNLSGVGLVAIVVPENMEVSNEDINLAGLPSIENKFGFSFEDVVDNDFDDMDTLIGDIGFKPEWEQGIVDSGVHLLYGSQVFNCATNKVNEETVFDYEMEYIICGKNSDYKNVKGVINKIIAIRLPINYSYLVKSSSKMNEIRKITLPLSLVVLIPEPILTYLVAGCWAYVEAIVDVRCLLEGKTMEFTKNSSNWITDLNDLENSLNYEADDNEKGLDYKDYMIMLMGMNLDKAYYRMLDVIELNTRQYYPNFRMKNGVVGFEAHFTIQSKYGTFYIKNYEEY